jgi:uncharacterized membrane protein YccC
VAGLGAFALAQALDLPQGYWAVFTALIVTQASVGGSLKASLDRLIGTLGGAIYGGIVATLVPHSDPLAFIGVLALTLAPLGFVAALYPRFRIAPLTATILLLSSAAQMGPLEAAAFRTLEISLGCVVGLAVSLLVLPARAHGLALRAAGRVLTLLARLIASQRARLLGETDAVAMTLLNDDIRRAQAKLEDAATEARHERASLLADQGDLEPVVRTLRRVRNDLVMVGRAAGEPLSGTVRDRLAPSLTVAMETAGALMAATGDALVALSAPPPLDAMAAALDAYGAAIAGLRRDGLTRDLSDNEVASLFALGFALEQWRRDFEELHARVAEFARPEATP